MRNLAAIALTGSILLASGPALAADPTPGHGALTTSLPLKVEPLAPEGAFWSLALPGAGQFYQGDHLRGATYLGATVGSTALVTGLQVAFYNALAPGIFWSGEQSAVVFVESLVASWLVVGGISAYDAYHSILAKQPAAPVATTLPAVAPSDPVPSPAPAAQVQAAAPTPPPVAQTPAPDAEAIIMESYRLADGGDHWQAVTQLQSISDPAWLPKARTLLSAWGDAAGAQGLATAREKLARGDRAAARAALDRLEKLPLKPTLRQQVLALRRELGDRP
ncbi:MAG TPA: hypothetical protein V6D00_00030 [Pantanalinema sp.]